VFADVSFTIASGEFVCIIGHSGCGKTTILNVLAGWTRQRRPRLHGRPRDGGPSLERGVVFQSHALMPWLTVRKNIAFAVVSRWPDWSAAQVDAQVEKFVAMVGLEAAIDKKPSQLSGGMKQRVGIARAFAIQPKMLLLDEPFGALDALTRGTIQDELMAIVRETQQTVFMITHDVDEAILLADRILLMSQRHRQRTAATPQAASPRSGQPAAARTHPRRPAPPARLLRPAQPHRRFPRHARQGALTAALKPLQTQEQTMNRNDITEKIITVKVSKGITWESDVAKKVGLQGMDHRRCLGQMTFDAKQAKVVGKIFRPDRRRTEVAAGRALQGLAAHRRADRSADLPLVRDRQRVRHHHQGTDPRGIRRRHHERDRLQHGHRAPADPKGDRVNVVLSGKFLPYKTYSNSSRAAALPWVRRICKPREWQARINGRFSKCPQARLLVSQEKAGGNASIPIRTASRVAR
jgi:ABC-type nitrate/sulfonate/bicarbonate transport system ATPase subunit